MAGGQSRRFGGEDKAFLIFQGETFIERIAKQSLSVSDDVILVIGKKETSRFENLFPGKVRIVKDSYDLGSPVSGILTACDLVKHSYLVVLGCDMPLVRASVLKMMGSAAGSHSAAVPTWEDGKKEPLCSVYNAAEYMVAAREAVNANAKGCLKVLEFLQDVVPVPVSEIRKLDPRLESLSNINSKEDLDALSAATFSR